MTNANADRAETAPAQAVWVITGASEGIGAELALQTAVQRQALVLAARKPAALEQIAQRCRALGALVEVVPTDVSERQQCQALIDRTLQRFGRIDTLINNAGISAHAQFGDVSAADLSWYEQLMRVNFWGSVWCTHAALPALLASRGRIAAISSLAGLVGVPGRTAYSASKFAMTGFFEALRIELKPKGISVTTAYPGVVATQIRHHGFNAQGQAAGVSGLDESNAMSAERCAQLILSGVNARKREVLMTRRDQLARWLKLAAPSAVDAMALAAVKAEHQP